jgi:hypothetical protein
MDYVEWCELVLRTIGFAGDESGDIRNYGIAQDSLARLVWGDQYAQLAGHLRTQEGADTIYDAVFDLQTTLLVDDSNATFIRLTREGRNAAKSIFPVWENACFIEIEPMVKNALKIINKHSHLPEQYFGRVRLVPMNTVHCEQDDNDMTQEDVWEVLGELKDLGLIYWDAAKNPTRSEQTIEDCFGRLAGIKLSARDSSIALLLNGKPRASSLSASFILTPQTKRPHSSKL